MSDTEPYYRREVRPGQFVEYDEPVRWIRPLVALIGRDRLYGWLDPELCPWMPADGRGRCENKKGHRGTCRTRDSRLNKQTGVWEVYFKNWYGINYDTGSG